MKKFRKSYNPKILITVLVTILFVFIIWIAWANKAIELNTFTLKSEKIPGAFHGYRIAHVSDLHNTEIGEENEILLAMIESADPDIIAITGDLIDSRDTNIEIAIQFVEETIKIAPCYYVTGNHEARVSEYDDLKKNLVELGVIILEDEKINLEQSEECITLLGVNDPSFQTDYLFGDSTTVMKSKLQSLINGEESYTILLSHRPELFEVYTENDVDLVLSGHAHGGQFRLPFVGGLFAPNQGVFPEYDAGLYTDDNTNMIVSKGIGNSLFPFRFNNRPEVILIELQTG